MNETIPEAFAALTGNGTAAGIITIADNTPFYAGALAWIWGTTAANRRVQIVRLIGTTQMVLRFHGNSTDGEDIAVAPTYGADNMTAYTTADAAKINMEAQVVRVHQPTFSKIPAR